MKTILLVDDDPLIRHIVSSVLEAEFRVISCDSGERALATLEGDSNIDLAIYDIDMPGINGIDTAKVIWDKYKIPFIIFSQFDEENIVEKAIEIGALTYLLKPLNTDKLLPAVKTALSRAKDISSQNNRAVELTLTINQNRRLLNSIIHEEESYRKGLVNELHDEVGQRLALIRMGVEKIKTITDQPEVSEKCTLVLENVTQLHQSIREIMQKLRPEILETLRTGSALHHLLTEWHKINSSIKIDDSQFNRDIHLSYPTDIIAYRALQEALTNISKYAEATKIIVSFQELDHSVLLKIKDDGKGFDMATTPFSIGLSGIREKVLSIGGQFSLETEPGEGVLMRLSLPYLENGQP